VLKAICKLNFTASPLPSLSRSSCEYNKSNLQSASRSFVRNVPEKRQSQTYSTDGQCGPAHGNLLCDPNSTVYTGTCCSQYGWVYSPNTCTYSLADATSAGTLLPTVAPGAFRVALMVEALLATVPLRQPPRVLLLALMGGAERTLVARPVTPRESMAAVARRMGTCPVFYSFSIH